MLCAHEGQLVVPQVVPQPPQLLLSLVRSRQTLLQSVSPPGQTHAEETHERPPAVLQVVPQPPQLLGSIVVFVQALLQTVRPPPQPPHVDAEHDWREL
jgi:hypothetical protein